MTDIRQRNEEIWRLRKEGATFSKIAKRFDLSVERARRICQEKQERIDNFDKWPPLKKILSARIQHVLINVFGSEEILGHPEKLASIGLETFLQWRNFGRKSMNELTEALRSLGHPGGGGTKTTDPESQIYFDIGKSILRDYSAYNKKSPVDDTEYIPIVRVIIRGITKEMESSGIGESNRKEVAEKLRAFNRSLYEDIWIEHAKEDHDPDEGPLDLKKEYESARYTFDYIYKHGKHPK